MKTLRIWTLALGLACGMVATVGSAEAVPKAKADKKADKKADAAEPATAVKPVSVHPKELAWGIDRKKLGEIYDKMIDDDFKAEYRKTQPGPAMDRLDATVAERKAEFRRSLVEFGAVHNGMDQTPLRPEFTYNNSESMMSIERGGKTRHFFFIGGKLWKIADVFKLGEKAAWGKSFEEASGKMASYYGVAGRVRAAEGDERPYVEHDWKDAVTQVRAVDWGGDQIAMVFQDLATVAQLPNLRKNKEAAKGVDAKLKDAARKEEPSPGPPAPPAKKPAPKK